MHVALMNSGGECGSAAAAAAAVEVLVLVVVVCGG